MPKKNGGFEGAVDWKSFEDSGWVLHKKDLKLDERIGHGEFGGNHGMCGILDPKFFAHHSAIQATGISILSK